MENNGEKRLSKFRLILNFISAYPMFKILLITSPLFFTLIVIGEVNIILTFSKMLKGMCDSSVGEAERDLAAKQALYHLFYNISYYLALQMASSAFIFYNMKLYRTVIVFYLIKTMNIDKHTFNRMGSGEIKDIIERKGNNIFMMIEYVFEKGVYHGLFIIYALFVIYFRFGTLIILYTLFNLLIFVSSVSVLIKRRNRIKEKYNAAHAKTSADRYNILRNYDIIKAYNKEVDDVNSMNHNLNEMTRYGNLSNFLSALSAFVGQVVLIIPNGILYYTALQYKFISSISTVEEFVAYNAIFCLLKSKAGCFRDDMVKVGQYSLDLETDDDHFVTHDIKNTLLYYNYTDNKVNDREPFVNVETLEHDTDRVIVHNDVRVRVGFDISKNMPVTISRCIAERTIVRDSLERNPNIELRLSPERSFVYNHEMIFQNLMVKASDTVLFNEANFSIKKGEKIALVGKNGTGKSTFLDIILRFKEYYGDIFIDGRNMNDIYKFDQRSKISYIPQNPGLISGSVLDNLRYHDYSIPQSFIEEVCAEFGYHEMFSNLPKGYDTDVGENGRFLSGGQKQKISFMRGIIKNGDIFIMDEPTANLDPQSELQIIDHIFGALAQKTVITIIHKHSLLSRFDKIIGIYNRQVQIYTDYNEFMIDSHLF